MSGVQSIFPGDVFTNNEGYTATVISYYNANKIDILFEVPYRYRLNTRAVTLRTGQFKNRNAPSVLGWGITGEGDGLSRAYITWHAMISRVKGKSPAAAYRSASIHPDWQWFEKFEKWYDKQVKEPDWHLDKDWIVPGNQLYSSKTCVFVPVEINSFITGSVPTRDHLLGVWYEPKTKKYRAYGTSNNRRCHLGCFDHEIDAHAVYVAHKESRAKILASIWKDRISRKLYKALLNYTVKEYAR